MKPYKWRNRYSGAVYVDSATGSDIFGTGTMDNPYRSLGRAWRGHTTYNPGTIYCRGTFSEDMSDGNHSASINGDYLGAATFDGAGLYTCYGFSTKNMVLKNCPASAYGLSASPSGSSLAGVGRADSADGVGRAGYVYGVAAPSVILRACGLYMGAIGGYSSVTNVAFVSPQANASYPLYFTANSSYLYNNTVYNVPISLRTQQRLSNGATLEAWIFGKCAFYVDEGLTFSRCLFASDCEFYDGDTLLTPEGETSAERIAWLTTYIENKGLASNKQTKFSDCVLSDKSSYEIFNDPDRGDVTPRYDTLDTDVCPVANQYRGAFPPAIHIPVLTDSEGVAGSWDEQTAAGCVGVQEDTVVLVDNGSARGEILSKVLVLDPNKVAISGLFADFANKYQTHGIHAGAAAPEGTTYAIGSTLPEGRYAVHGGPLLAGDQYVSEGEIIVAGADGLTITMPTEDGVEDAYAAELVDANVEDVMLLRTCPTAYCLLTAADGLQKGGTYCNIYNMEITYRGRRIAHNESFIAVNDTDTFSCDDSSYRVAAIFDDTRVPSQPWIQAQMWGEYFAGRAGGVYQTDTDGNIISSGNYLAWQPSSQGGYSEALQKVRAHARYVQLKLQVHSNLLNV